MQLLIHDGSYFQNQAISSRKWSYLYFCVKCCNYLTVPGVHWQRIQRKIMITVREGLKTSYVLSKASVLKNI